MNPLYSRYYTTVMSNFNALHNYLDTHETVAANKNIKKTFYNSNALKVFQPV